LVQVLHGQEMPDNPGYDLIFKAEKPLAPDLLAKFWCTLGSKVWSAISGGASGNRRCLVCS